MEIINDEYYRDMIRGMNEDQAIEFTIAKVREAIVVTRLTNERLEGTLDLMAARYLSR